MEITDEILTKAMSKAVQLGALPKYADTDRYLKAWGNMKEILEAAFSEEEPEEEMRLRMLKSMPLPEDPGKRTIPHIMALEFPDVDYEIMQDDKEMHMHNMRVNYHDPKEIEQAILERIPAIFGVTVTEF